MSGFNVWNYGAPSRLTWISVIGSFDIDKLSLTPVDYRLSCLCWLTPVKSNLLGIS